MLVSDKSWIIIIICTIAVLLVGINHNNLNDIPLNPTEPTNLVGQALHPLYAGFSSTISGFNAINTLEFSSTDTQKFLTFSITDDAVYRTAYVSINGADWQQVSLTGTILGGYWLQRSATGTINILKSQISAGTNTNNYIIVYSCRRGVGSWDCYDGLWQIYTFTTIRSESCTPSCVNKQCGADGCSGTCGMCINMHGTTSCSSAGICQPVCSSGYGNCDGNNTNGCETLLGTITNCAMCGNICTGGTVCKDNACVIDIPLEPKTIWTDELMINGGFENGNFNGWIVLSDSGVTWNVGNSTGGSRYAPQSGSFCAYTISGNNENGSIYQDVDLTAYANYIDSNTALINVTGWLVSAEYSGQDMSWMKVLFLNSAKGVIQTALNTGIVDNIPWWQSGITMYAIPANTRYVRVWATTIENYTGTCCNSGNLDSFSVKLGYSVANGTKGDSVPIITFESPTPISGSVVSSSVQTIAATISDDSVVSSWIDFDNSLLLWLRLDGGSVDSSSRHWSAIDGGVSYVGGMFGEAASGFSEDNKIIVDSALDFASTDMTISFWVNVYDYTVPERQNPFGKAFGGDGTLTLESSGTMNFYFGSSGVDDWPYTSPSSEVIVIPNVWEHWVVVRDVDSHTAQWFKNGVAASSVFDYSVGTTVPYAGDGAIDVVAHSVAPLTIGNSYENPLNGAVDEFMIFNRVLTPSEILALYDSRSNKFSVSFNDLSNGLHSYTVYAVDVDGNVASSGLRTFTVQASTACVGLSTQSCTIINGNGSQSRTCNSGTWSAWSTCTVTSCNTGYTQSGNTCIPSSSSGKIYYLSPSGNDQTGNGSIARPWFTLNKAWTVVQAGDTVYLRGGTYEINSVQMLSGKSGTASNMIKILAYPGEKPLITPSSTFTSTAGIGVEGVNYLHLKGLEIAGFEQTESSNWYNGIYAGNINYCIFEQLDVHHNGFGFSIGNWGSGSSTGNIVLNSDFHHNSDPLTAIEDNRPWGGSDGLTIRVADPNAVNTITGCRMWWNSDDGLDLWANEGMIILNNSWAFWNGFQPGNFLEAGDGNGFKLGPTYANGTPMKRKITNNIAFQNKLWGFVDNAAKCNMEVYNNIAYQNCYQNYETWCGGFYFTMIRGIPYYMKNNIAYAQAGGYDVLLDTLTNINHNSWDSSVIITDADFISVIPAGVDGPRKADGSLPDITFLHLAQGSDLIDKGTNVGLPFSGTYPDLGAFESAVSATCVGSPTQSCSITNGVGSQSRTCNSGVWSSWSTCTVTSCNTCYTQSGNTCVAATCSGSTTQSCSITNGVGSQSRTCSCGVWSSWSSCTVTSCNSGYTPSGNTCIPSSSSTGFVVDHTSTNLNNIPLSCINRAKSNLHIAYEHTSHGEQLVQGMTGLVTWKGSTYAFSSGGGSGVLDFRDHAISPWRWSDLGTIRDPNNYVYNTYDWARITRTYLDANPTINVVIWSWCSEVPSLSTADVDRYLSEANAIERDYPNVKFIYMTGHVDVWNKAPNDPLYVNNKRIKDYCIANNKILYDFADIESYDPNGNYYGDKHVSDCGNYDYDNSGETETDGGDPGLPVDGDRNWMLDWQASHTQNVDWYNCASSHTYPINANRKAYAAWHLWARLAGWNGNPSSSCS
ncbi:MAG: right-handed parallel beta-helix repeat-containing protein [Candidatus Woesearchaeota archaeon]